MSKYRNTAKDDIFLRSARLRARQDVDAREMHRDASSAQTEAFFQALVASVAVIAHADGRLELAERRALLEAFITSPAMTGFSVAELAQELAEHARTYGYDPTTAEIRALASLSASTIGLEERQAILQICHQVITSDGLVHPVELGALHRVERALGLSGGQS